LQVLITPIARVRSEISLGWNWADTAAKASSGAWVSEISVTASAHCRAAFSLSVKMSPASRHAETSISR
jgi:hypothetical protein